MNVVKCIRFYDEKINHTDIKSAAFVIPIFYPSDGSEPQIIMVRAAPGSKRVGKIEFPGGTNDGDELDIHTAAREAREETCGYLDITANDLYFCPRKVVAKNSVFIVKVPFMTNTKFQENLSNEKRKAYLEMDKLVRIPISQFYKNGKLIFPVNDIPVESIYGTKFIVWKWAAMMIFHAFKKINIS